MYQSPSILEDDDDDISQEPDIHIDGPDEASMDATQQLCLSGHNASVTAVGIATEAVRAVQSRAYDTGETVKASNSLLAQPSTYNNRSRGEAHSTRVINLVPTQQQLP